MKKTLLLLASAALLFVSCAKEKFAEPSDGDLTNVTFTANVDGGVATKAFDDNDGNGTYVNRCIMEIYFQDQLYKRMEAAMSGNPATTTFANVPVVAGKEYQILFWADCGGEELADKYYTTETEEDNMGLKAVTVNQTAFLAALTAGDNDELDAFFFADNYTVPQNPTQPFNVSLKRPFAQLNVITTDINKTVTSAALLPDKVSVSYKADNILNVATGETSRVGEVEDYTFAYEAPVYGDKTDWAAIKNRGEYTLSMDYILAPATEQGAVDVTFKTFNNGDANPVMTHSLTNLPYKRNYRTNVKGDLLTAAGSWTAEIDPIWSSPDIVKVVEVADIKSANEIIKQYAETTNQLEVKFTAEPNDSGEPTGELASAARAIVTTPIKENNTLSIEVLADTKKLYIGDYPNEYTVTSVDTEHAKHAVVNVNVPKDKEIKTLIINAPSKSVYINGKEVANVGTITDLDAITSQNTLIIEKGQTVNKLTIRQGGLEIHGTVEKAIVPEGHGTIVVRDCENLDEDDVYNVLKDHIALGYVGVKGRTTEDLWDIVPIVCKIDEIGYGTLADAVAKVQEGQTITLVKDVENAVGIAINTGKTFTIDFNNHKYTVNKPGAGSTGTQTAAFQLIKGQTITFKNGIIKAAEDNLTAAVAPAKNIKRMFQSYANVTFEGMIIDGTNLYENNSVCEFVCGAVDIKGTTSITTGKQGVAVINVDTWKGAYPEGAQVTISSTGEFGDIYLYAEESGDYTKSSLTITDGKFDKVYGDDSGDWTASISGGVFSEKPADEIVAAGYAVLDNPDATTKAQYPWAVDRKGVAKIGTTIYYDLKDAIDAVPAGTETETMITMLDNVAGTATFTIPSNKNICLELNGKSIYASSTTATNFALFANKGIFTVQDNTDTHKDGTGTGKLSTIAYDPDMKPVPGYATNTITNYGTLNIKSGLIESGSEGKASYAIDNEAENAQWNNSSNKTITLNVSGGRIVAGASYSIRMYLATSGQYDNIINIDNAHIGSLWVQDNDGATAAKGTLTISNSTFENNLLVGYECYSEHFSLNVSNSVFGGKFHYQLNSEAEGNTISIDNISAAPFFMDSPGKKVLHNGTITIKGEFSYGWVEVEDENKKTELEAAGWRLESDPNYTTWFHGYLTEAGILNYLKDCIEDGYEAVCVDQTAGKYEIKAK